MTRLGLALLCLVMAACSTAMYPYADDELEPGQGASQTPLDASVSDASILRDTGTRLPDTGIGFPPGFLIDGSLPPWFFDDASVFDASFPFWPEASVPFRPDAGGVDFEYGCDVYNVPVSCPDRGVTRGRTCQAHGANCPTIVGGGEIEWLTCQPAVGTTTFQWQYSSFSRCGYNCPVDMPAGVAIPLTTQDCGRRQITDCQQSAQGVNTSQEGADYLLNRVVIKCGIPFFELGITFNSEGCPSTAHANLSTGINGAQINCLQSQLTKLRLSCDVPCAVSAWVGAPPLITID